MSHSYWFYSYLKGHLSLYEALNEFTRRRVHGALYDLLAYTRIASEINSCIGLSGDKVNKFYKDDSKTTFAVSVSKLEKV